MPQSRARTQPTPQPLFVALFGAMDAGKTYYMERLVDKMRNRTVIVYNYGKPSDWVGFDNISLLLEDKELHFEYNREVYHFERDFMRLFRNGRVKILTVVDKNVIKAFYQCLAQMDNNIRRLALLFEDATAIFDSKIGQLEKGLFSRCKHKDIWIYTLSHDLNYYPIQLYTLATHIILFRTHNPPPKSKREKIGVYNLLQEGWEWLTKKQGRGKKKTFALPPYHHVLVDTQTHELHKYDPNNQLIK